MYVAYCAVRVHVNVSSLCFCAQMVIESRKLDAVSGESPAGLPSVNSSMSLIPPPAARNPGLLRSASSASFYSTPPPAASLAPQGGSVVRVATLHLIDLAGSERVSKSGAAGMQVKESGVINASLLTLGVVINKLISGEAHIPYRDSKLTRLLSTSLGGNAKTAVVVTVAPSSWNIGETRSSLQFAARAMKVSDVRLCAISRCARVIVGTVCFLPVV